MTSRPRVRTLFATVGLAAALAVTATPVAADLPSKVKAALADESRPAKDAERDRNRQPLKTLEFFQLSEDMRVLELMPGGGWYTRILAPVMKESGKLYVAVGTTRIEESLLTQPGFEEVEVVTMKGDFNRAEGARRFDISNMALDVKEIDLALTFRNLHNITEAGRNQMNRAVYKALKPGGLYGVIDHTRRHMGEDTSESWRRLDPVAVIKEVQAAGFELVDFSDVHHRPDDELIYEVGRRSVTGNTDRFTLLFRKPKS
ncbi:MAG: methyltransferase [Pseudomonadota bacterium]